MAVGSATADRVPVVARVAACRVSDSRDAVTLIVFRSQSHSLLEAVRDTGRVAVFFSEPSTHKSLQIKGNDARIVRLLKTDVEAVRQHTEAFVAEIVALGFPESFVRGLAWADLNDLAAFRFTPSEAFLQTPGPRAGFPLPPTSA